MGAKSSLMSGGAKASPPGPVPQKSYSATDCKKQNMGLYSSRPVRVPMLSPKVPTMDTWASELDHGAMEEGGSIYPEKSQVGASNHNIDQGSWNKWSKGIVAPGGGGGAAGPTLVSVVFVVCLCIVPCSWSAVFVYITPFPSLSVCLLVCLLAPLIVLLLSEPELPAVQLRPRVSLHPAIISPGPHGALC